MLSPGAMIAGYKVVRVIGTGGMGVVYLVDNPELPRRDALKVLNAEFCRDEAFRKRFTREADVASVLDHPNIVSIYRRGTTEDGLLWIAMQFVDGTDAEAALRAGQMTAGRAVHTITEVAKALDHAHARNVVHRDVKPANFLLSGPVGPNERVLLADFGIARALDDAGITAAGSVTATLAYAAPEILTGGRADARSDIYSLGCALFRLLSGKAPYASARTAAALMTAHIQSPPPRLTVEAPQLPPAMDAVIAKAMAKDPAQRFRTASEFAQAAAAALRGGYPRPAQPQQQWPPSGPAYPPRQQQFAPAPQRPVPQWPASQPQQRLHQPPSQPHYPGAPPSSSGSPGKRRAIVIGAVATVIMLVAAVSIAVAMNSGSDAETAPTTTTTTTAPPAPLVETAALQGFLLPANQLANLVGSSELVSTESTPHLSDDAALVTQGRECLGPWVPSQREVYAGTGWTAVHQELLRNAGEGPLTHSVTQLVVLFPDVEGTDKVLDEQKAVWEKCAGQVVTAKMPNGEILTYTLGAPETDDGITSMLEMREGGGGWGCGRAITARNNVMVDVMTCRGEPGGQATAIAKAIADKIPV